MNQPSLAARRFYHAFYRWNLLLPSAGRPRHHRPFQLSGCSFGSNKKHSFHNTRPSSDEDQLQHPHNEIRVRSHSAGASKRKNHPPKWLTDTPVSSTDRPFDTLAIWEDVVRYRSTAGIMIQTAVPPEQIEHLEQLYGNELKEMVKTLFPRHGSVAKIEVGDTVALKGMHGKEGQGEQGEQGGRVMARSVLYSGSANEAGFIRAALRDTRIRIARHTPAQDLRERSEDGNADSDGAVSIAQHHPSKLLREQLPKHAERHLVVDKPAWGLPRPFTPQKGPTQSENDAHSALPSSTSIPRPAPPPSLSSPYEKRATPSWLLTPPKTPDDFPTNTLQPLVPTLRRRSADSSTINVEVVIPANEYWDSEVMQLLQKNRPGVELELLDVFSSAVQRTGEITWRRAIVTKGSVEGVRNAVNEILDTPTKVLKNMDVETDAFSPNPVAESSRVGLNDQIHQSEEGTAPIIRPSNNPTHSHISTASATPITYHHPRKPSDFGIFRRKSPRTSSGLNDGKASIVQVDKQAEDQEEGSQIAETPTDRVPEEKASNEAEFDLVENQENGSYAKWVRLAVPAQAIGHILSKRRDIWESERCFFQRVEGTDTSEQKGEGYVAISGPGIRNIERAVIMVADLLLESSAAHGIASEGSIRIIESSHRTFYSRFSVPASEAGFMVGRARQLSKPGSSLHPEQLDAEEHGDEAFFTIWSDDKDQLDQAKDRAKLLWSKRSRKDAGILMRFVEDGVDNKGLFQKLLQRRAAIKARLSRAGLRAYAVFTIPNKAVPHLVSADHKIMLKRCLLQVKTAAERFQGENQMDEDRTSVILWGQTPKDVKAGTRVIEMHMLGRVQTGRLTLKEFELTVLEEGMGDTPYEETNAQLSVLPEGGSHVEQMKPSSPVVDGNEAYFEAAEQTGQLQDQPFTFEQEGSAASPTSEEPDDDILFPEFFPEADALYYDEQQANAAKATNSSASPRYSPVNFFKRGFGIQQRAYSTRMTPERPDRSVSSAIDSSDRTINVSEGREVDESNTSSEQLAEDLKRTLRTLTHPVVLITSRVLEPKGDKSNSSTDDPSRGVTVSSLNTITLTPTPMISFNLRVPSRSWDAIESSGRFAAYFLAATPEGAVLAHAFTQPYERSEEPFLRLQRLGVQIIGGHSSSGAAPPAHATPPLIKWPGAIIAQVTASILPDKCVHVGDHVVVIAEVKSVSLSAYNDKGTSETVNEAVGLAYAMRGFRGVAEEIEPLELPELVSAKSTSAEPDPSASQTKTNSSQTNRGEPKRRTSHQGATTPSLRSHYSTLANTKEHGCCNLRSFATSSASVPGNDQSQEQDKQPSSFVSDTELLSSTVGEFLGTPEGVFVRPARIRSLVRARKEAKHASRALERSLADGSLTPEESARLENVVTRNERRVAKTLALRSANDLRAMLDSSHVDFRRAQWLESSIEKGQAILLEEARQIRQMLDEKTISSEQFLVVKEKLEQQNQILTAEATRLRQMVDEESEGGGRVNDRGAFDGFQGNI